MWRRLHLFALVLSDIVWSKENLSEYLANPRKFIPGTKTVKLFAGSVKKEEDRANLIAYLKKQKWNAQVKCTCLAMDRSMDIYQTKSTTSAIDFGLFSRFVSSHFSVKMMAQNWRIHVPSTPCKLLRCSTTLLDSGGSSPGPGACRRFLPVSYTHLTLPTILRV